MNATTPPYAPVTSFARRMASMKASGLSSGARLPSASSRPAFLQTSVL
jgi:hypothetical protein